jgi:hypothetical protein
MRNPEDKVFVKWTEGSLLDCTIPLAFAVQIIKLNIQNYTPQQIQEYLERGDRFYIGKYPMTFVLNLEEEP